MNRMEMVDGVFATLETLCRNRVKANGCPLVHTCTSSTLYCEAILRQLIGEEVE